MPKMGENTFEDYDDDFDYDFDANQNQNDALKQARAAARANAKLVKELKAEKEELAKTLAEFRVKEHQSSVGDLLKAKGANPKLARWLAKDEVEATDEAVTKWLADNGELFGYDPSANGAGTGEADSDGGAGGELDQEQNEIFRAMGRVQNSEANASPGLTPNRKLDEKLAAIGKSANSFEDVVKGLQDSGLI